MCYLYLFLAIIFEIFGTTLMKLSNSLSVLWPSIGMFVAYALCFGFLSFALKEIEVSVAYAIWSALGIAIISIIGLLFFNEHLNLIKACSILLIIIGVVGLQLSGMKH